MRENDIVRKGASDLMLLTLLQERDMYGYELRKLISERSGGDYAIPEGTMYIYLYRMSEKGYVSERRELVGKRRQRVYYHIEPSGRAYLAELQERFEKAFRGLKRFYETSGKPEDGHEQ